MSQYCPCCQAAISAPSLNQYDDYFICPHCEGALSHHHMDILLYALGFIALCTVVLILLFGTNGLAALGLSLATYHLVRPKLLESSFRLQVIDLFQRNG